MKNAIANAIVAFSLSLAPAAMFSGAANAATCSLSGSTVSCDKLNIVTQSSALEAIDADQTKTLYSFYETNKSAWQSMIGTAYAAGKTRVTLLGYDKPYWGNKKYYDLQVAGKVVPSTIVTSVDRFYANLKNNTAEIFANYVLKSVAVSAVSTVSTTSRNQNVPVTSYNIAAVPGPEAGAGFGALAMAGMAFWMKRRRNTQAA